MRILAVQERLLSLGFDLGPAGADGIRGRMTNRAIRQFQGRAGLQVTGQLNRQTVGALFPGESNLDVPADRFHEHLLAD